MYNFWLVECLGEAGPVPHPPLRAARLSEPAQGNDRGQPRETAHGNPIFNLLLTKGFPRSQERVAKSKSRPSYKLTYDGLCFYFITLAHFFDILV